MTSRRNMGKGHPALKDHPNAAMRDLYAGKTVVLTMRHNNEVVRACAVTWFCGGMAWHLETPTLNADGKRTTKVGEHEVCENK